MEVIAIVTLLCAVGYGLGTALCTSPAPALRRAGRVLIEDSILVLGFSIILYATHLVLYELPALVGLEAGDFLAWVEGEIVRLGGVVALFSGIEFLVGGMVFYPLAAMVGAAALVLIKVYNFGKLFITYSYSLIVLGVVLYSLPVRIGRQAGAGIIAATLVLNVGLPFMPLFVAEFAKQGIFVPVEEVEAGIVGEVAKEFIEAYFTYVMPHFVLSLVFLAIIGTAIAVVARARR